MNKRTIKMGLLVAMFAAVAAPGCAVSTDSDEEEVGDVSEAVTTDTLLPSQSLSSNQSLFSANGKYKLVMQGSDSHLVIYNTVTGQAIWAASASGPTGWVARMQTDGNFVIYSGSTAKWATGTNGTSDGDYFLRMEDTGSLVLYRGTTTAPRGMLWSSTEDVSLVKKFAPRLRFDGAAPDYPASASDFYAVKDTVNNSTHLANTTYSYIQNNDIPTYYQVTSCGSSQTRINYWWFYGYQSACDAFGDGTHNGDWEHVMVTLSEDKSKIAAVTYYAHAGHYTRLTARDGVKLEDTTHPVIYAGKTTHASYFEQGGSGSCLYWEDWHNNGDGSHMDTWNNVLSLSAANETWMVADRSGGFSWGGGEAVSTHPTQSAPSCSAKACSYDAIEETAYMHSQCKKGDDDTGTSCLKKCGSGYTDTGLLCSKCSGKWYDPTSWHCNTYAKTIYDYDYTLSTTDDDLL